MAKETTAEDTEVRRGLELKHNQGKGEKGKGKEEVSVFIFHFSPFPFSILARRRNYTCSIFSTVYLCVLCGSFEVDPKNWTV